MPLEQRSLFDEGAMPWDEDDAGELLVATIVFPSGPAAEFDYAVPERLRSAAQAGKRFKVPLGRGNRPETGYCVRLATKNTSGRKLKEVLSVVDRVRLLSPPMLRLTEWMAEHYLSSWGQVLETVLPAGVRFQAGTRNVTVVSVPPEVRARLAELKLPAKQAQAIRRLAEFPEGLPAGRLADELGCTQAPIDALRKKGLIVAATRREHRSPQAAAPAAREEHLELNADQRLALEAIRGALHAGRHETLLLEGITGSGKTEVYIQAIQEVIGFGRQAIVLVPEISLTPQTQRRFRARFGHVAVLHSHLSDVERHEHWRQIASGEVPVIVGARSAVFAPTPHLGLIVLDEEHEASFKQDSAPRYHARDVALQRARWEGVPLVLGSATPSLESWHAGQQGEYRLLRMPRRVFDRPLPAVGTIDLRNEARSRGRGGSISRALAAAMEATLAEGGQAILLLNRRGYSTHIQCPACGAVVRCPRCDIALTHHRQAEMALCHYCDFQIRTPAECPECQFAGIRYSGVGTQRLEAEVQTRFPGYRSLRMDTDSMQRHGSHERALAAFRAGEIQILLGTQMIAKGLDFPNVTLVGVVNADTALHLPDFRAAERTCQLLVQVAGRTGRGEKGGRVLVQTFSPDHPAIRAATRHDYESFARQELGVRQALEYPPLSSMVRLVVRGPKAEMAQQFAVHLAERLHREIDRRKITGRLLGPAPAPLARLKGLYRFQLQLQSQDGDALRESVRDATRDVKPPDELQFMVDVDPWDML